MYKLYFLYFWHDKVVIEHLWYAKLIYRCDTLGGVNWDTRYVQKLIVEWDANLNDFFSLLRKIHGLYKNGQEIVSLD